MFKAVRASWEAGQAATMVAYDFGIKPSEPEKRLMFDCFHKTIAAGGNRHDAVISFMVDFMLGILRNGTLTEQGFDLDLVDAWILGIGRLQNRSTFNPRDVNGWLEEIREKLTLKRADCDGTTPVRSDKALNDMDLAANTMNVVGGTLMACLSESDCAKPEADAALMGMFDSIAQARGLDQTASILAYGEALFAMHQTFKLPGPPARTLDRLLETTRTPQLRPWLVFGGRMVHAWLTSANPDGGRCIGLIATAVHSGEIPPEIEP